MPLAPPRYPLGRSNVYYDGHWIRIAKRELRDDKWWYEDRQLGAMFGGTWIPGNDPRLQQRNPFGFVTK